MVIPKEKVDAVEEDKKDNMVLECALEAKAEFIVTGDHHLRTLKEFRNITILTPREFIESVSLQFVHSSGIAELI